MQRLDCISREDITRWDIILENDDLTPEYFKSNVLLREVLYSGFWLMEQLRTLGCEELIITQIQFTHGSMSYGQNCWQIAEELLAAYKNDELEFVDEEEVSAEIEKIKAVDVPRDESTQN